MASTVIKKISDFFGLGEQIEDLEDTTPYEKVKSETESPASNKPKKSKVVPLNPNIPAIEIMNPESFNDASDIVKYIQDHKIVILKIGLLSKEEKRRAVDFASGAATALYGDIRKLSNDLFIVIPNGIEVFGDYENNFNENNISKWSF